MKNFLIQILTSGSGVSSKRFNGTYGYATVTLILVGVVIIDLWKDMKLDEITASLIQVYLFTSAGLLGLGGAIEGIKAKLTK